jgi:prepilin-type N-terminal cleavage/methylation domain-containing protein
MRAQRGFTLMEVLASTMATGIVIAAATAFLLRWLGWYDELSSRIAINQHARETYDLLALGGRGAANGKDGTRNVYGLRGMNKKPGGPQRNNYALQFKSNNITLMPDTLTGMAVKCTGDGTPLPDCGGGPGATKTVTGWIGSDIKLEDGPKSVSGRTVQTTFTVFNPYQVQRAANPALFAEVYRTIFTYNRDEDDPH